MKILIITISLLISISLFAQEKDKRNLEAFNQIETYGSIKLKLIKDNEELIKTETQNFDINDIKISVKDSVLRIRHKPKFKKEYKINIVLHYKSIDKITAGTASLIYNTKEVKTDSINIKAIAGGEIKLNIKSLYTSAKATGGSTITLNGNSNKADFSANTGGVINAQNIICKVAKIKVGSASKIHAQVTDNLKAKTSMGGHLNIYGKPNKQDIKTSVGGTYKIIRKE